MDVIYSKHMILVMNSVEDVEVVQFYGWIWVTLGGTDLFQKKIAEFSDKMKLFCGLGDCPKT